MAFISRALPHYVSYLCFQGRRLHPSGASSSLKQMLWLEAHVKIQNAETSGGYKNFK